MTTQSPLRRTYSECKKEVEVALQEWKGETKRKRDSSLPSTSILRPLIPSPMCDVSAPQEQLQPCRDEGGDEGEERMGSRGKEEVEEEKLIFVIEKRR